MANQNNQKRYQSSGSPAFVAVSGASLNFVSKSVTTRTDTIKHNNSTYCSCSDREINFCEKCCSLKRVNIRIKHGISSKQIFQQYFNCLSKQSTHIMVTRVAADMVYRSKQDDVFRNMYDHYYRTNRNIMSKELRHTIAPICCAKTEIIIKRESERHAARDLKMSTCMHKVIPILLMVLSIDAGNAN
jgi:hypothetical protein